MGKKAEDLDSLQRMLREMLPDLRARYGVRYLGVFGSYATGRQTKRSDVDLLVDFDESADDLSLFQFVALEQELGKAVGHKVDLVERSALKPFIGKRVLEEVNPV